MEGEEEYVQPPDGLIRDYLTNDDFKDDHVERKGFWDMCSTFFTTAFKIVVLKSYKEE